MEFASKFTKKRIVTIAVVVVILAAVLYVVYDFNGKSLDLRDRETRLIVTWSMDGEDQPYDIKSIPEDSLVMIKHLDRGEMGSIEVGDVIAFHYQGRLTVHRVAELETDSEGNLTGFETIGDFFLQSPTGHYEHPTLDDVKGVVVGVSPALGKTVTFIQDSPIFLIMVIVILLIIASVIRDMVRIYKGEDDDVQDGEPAEEGPGTSSDAGTAETSGPASENDGEVSDGDKGKLNDERARGRAWVIPCVLPLLELSPVF